MLDYKRVFIGSVCNNDCVYCPHEIRQSRPLQEIEAELGAGAGRDGIEIYGGEPLERFDFSRLVTMARALNRRVKVVTNGRALAKPEVVRSAVEAGATGFEVKLWGPREDVHDGLTGKPGSFYETLQGISNARGLFEKAYLAIRAKVCRENIDRLADISRIAASFRVDRLIIEPVDPELSVKEAEQSIKLAIETAITNRVWAMTEGIPLCAMRGYEPHVGEAVFPRPSERVKVEACSRCPCDGVCDGVSPLLADKFAEEAEPAENVDIVEDLRSIRDERKAESPARSV